MWVHRLEACATKEKQDAAGFIFLAPSPPLDGGGLFLTEIVWPHILQMMRKIISNSGAPGPKTEALTRFISLLRQHFPDISARYQVKSLGLFGSFVSGQPKKGSDLDILVEFHEAPSLFRFLALERELRDLLGLKIDLVMKEALKPNIGEHIMREVIAV